MAPRIKFISLIISTALIMIGALAVIFVWQLPSIRGIRQKIDADRASIFILQQQQSNLQALKQDRDSISNIQKEIDLEIWSFDKEDTFYSLIGSLAKSSGVTADEPKISDATPTNKALTRTVTITCRGRQAKLLSFLNAIQNNKPLLAISEVTLSSQAEPSMTVTLQTLWR